MLDGVKSFLGYTYQKADDFFENEITECVDQSSDEWAKPGLDLAETLVNLKVIKDSDECLDGLEKKFHEIANEMEDKMGIKFEDMAEFEDSVENFKIVIGHFFKVMLPIMWREHKHFYFIKRFIFMCVGVAVFMSVFRALNPKTWYRFWKGYLEQR